MRIAWWSAGVTSAVACKIALELYQDVKIVYIDTGSGHPDNERFKKDCEKWYGKEILTIGSWMYEDVFDVIKRTRYVNGVSGARCTTELKVKVRKYFEKSNHIKAQIWGFDFSKKEENRAKRLQRTNPNYQQLFPLLERKLTKSNCLHILKTAGIDKPVMYRLGYTNNNCIGCVKGGMGYWNKIRKDFPEVFNKMANLEREVGRSCVRKYFLDELPPGAGNILKEIMPDCGVMCSQELKGLDNE